jgi:hypothetical protein
MHGSSSRYQLNLSTKCVVISLIPFLCTYKHCLQFHISKHDHWQNYPINLPLSFIFMADDKAEKKNNIAVVETSFHEAFTP